MLEQKVLLLKLLIILYNGCNKEEKKNASFKYPLSFTQGVVDGKGLKANEWVKEVSTIIGGKGGGKPISAQGSGENVGDIDKAINLAKEFASLKLS